MIKLHFKTFGDKLNVPLLLLHGFMGESSDWKSLAERLQHSYYCIAVDLPGHGQSSSEDESEYTIEKTTESIVELLRNQNIDKCNLLGYSMGGRVAYYLITHFPEMFQKAIIESSSPGLKTENEKEERVQKDLLISKRLQMQPLEMFLDDWYNLELFSSIDKTTDSFKNMIARKAKNNPKQLALSLKYSGTGAMPSLWDKLDIVQADVLLITGNLDKKYTNIAKEICKEHDNFSHHIINNVSHNVHFENEEIFYKTIDTYLR